MQTMGSAQVLDAGTIRRSAAAVLTASTYITIVSPTGDVNNGTPQTFANGDFISWTIAYQAA